MKFIRSFWGDLNSFNGHYRREIIDCSKRSDLNELVFVWGTENFDFISGLGFKCALVDERPTQYGEDFLLDSNIYMLHKIEAVKLGTDIFKQVIFLDWDCVQMKPIDKNFFRLLSEQDHEIQMPLYTYPKNYSEVTLSAWPDIPERQQMYIAKQQHYLEKHHFAWGDNFVTPNAGFIFCANGKIMDELIKINADLQIGIASEEMTFLEYSKERVDTLENYIKRYEPLVCNAKPESHFSQNELNDYMSSFIQKDLYFIHH